MHAPGPVVANRECTGPQGVYDTGAGTWGQGGGEQEAANPCNHCSARLSPAHFQDISIVEERKR